MNYCLLAYDEGGKKTAQKCKLSSKIISEQRAPSKSELKFLPELVEYSKKMKSMGKIGKLMNDMNKVSTNKEMVEYLEKLKKETSSQ
jgi:hypothetical protein